MFWSDFYISKNRIMQNNRAIAQFPIENLGNLALTILARESIQRFKIQFPFFTALIYAKFLTVQLV